MELKEIKNKNFETLDYKFIEELNSKGYYLRHKKTGAQVLYLDNDDEIKTFGIGFRTPPFDSTGVAHIVEHCVLSGSRKYRTKEPFMDLINSSMQVFLNAMTFPDKTIYPISSRNTKDFYNLMDVYLDAVFYPRIYEEEKIFKQEGWHYELEEKDGDIIYNGVVYNEMRGSYSDGEGQVLEILAHNLHPNSTYAHDSGGNPYQIVDLKYEDFLDFHKRYYHPSNSYIFLNGQMDIEEVLDHIDGEYLSNFDKIDPKSDIVISQGFKEPRTVETYYSVGKDDSLDKKAYLVYGVNLGESTSAEDSIVRDLLSEILLDSDSSVLKERLLKSQIAEDYYMYSSSSLPLDMYFVAKNADGGDLDRYVELINTGLRDAIKGGIDKDLVQAAMTKAEFSLKDMGIHKGVYLGIMALSGWLYGTNPLETLSFNDSLEKIKAGLGRGYLEDYIEKRILLNPHKIYLKALPKPGMFAENDKRLEDQLKKYKEDMTEAQLENLVRETQDLFAYQLSEDSKEDKETIPKLDLEDISEEIKRLNTRLDEGEFTKIHVDEFTNGIVYQAMAFDIGHLKEEDLAYVGIISDLLGSLDTENYSYRDLNNKIYTETGGIGFSAKASMNLEEDRLNVFFAVTGRSMDDKVKELEELTEEIMLRSKFDDMDRIKELLVMRKSAMDSDFEPSGHRNVMNEVQGMLTDSGYLNNLMSGNKYYFFIRDIIENFEEKKAELKSKLEDIYKKLFSKKFALSLAGSRANYDYVTAYMTRLREDFVEFEERLVVKRDGVRSIALKNSSNVVYVAEAYDYGHKGFEYSGDLVVLGKILNGNYIHTNVRAKGGAYGGGVGVNNNKTISFYSYRDPNLDQTYRVYENTKNFVKNLDISEEELRSYIISTMNQFDPPVSPSSYASMELMRYINGVKIEKLEELKKQALETRLEDLRKYWKLFDVEEEDKVFAVLGSRNLIEKSKKKFEEIKDLS